MPGGIIQDEYVSGPVERDVLVGVIQEYLEDLRIGMAEFKRMEFTRSGQDHTGGIHSRVSAGIGLTNFVPLHCKASSWTRVAFDTALVKKPKANILITSAIFLSV